MCGITGIIANNAFNLRQNIFDMVHAIRHRGPDEQGFYTDDAAVLGHARLSIVDIAHGKQPIKSSLTNNVIILNGEIYGYKSLREELAQEYNFKTNTDTEVILALFDKYGSDLMPKVPGMFSFAIWNPDQKKLFAARDRFGEKPFFYAFGRNGEFIFASEIKAIIASGLVDPVVDMEVAASFLRTMYVNSYNTIYKNIHVLPQAHQLIYSCETKSLKIERYWQMPQINQKISLNEATEEFSFLFRNAVKKQLVADVEVGAFLSGGLDSSSIVAIASEFSSKLRTISFGFSDKNDTDVKNELVYSSAVAKMYGTNHISIEDRDSNFADLFIKMVGIYDEPFGDSSSIPTYLVSKEAAKHTKVVLTGDGADELLAGYTWIYKALYSMEKNKSGNSAFKELKDYLVYKIAKKRRRILKRCGRNTFVLDQKISNLAYLKTDGLNISQYHASGRYGFSFNENLEEIGFYDRVFAGGSSECKNRDYEEVYKFLNKNYAADDITLDDILKIDLSDYMVGDILVKVDRATMANSLEARAPFLDVDLASFCISLPYCLKISDDSDKLIMRKSLEEKWPEEIRKRPKHGFGSPIRKLLESSDFKKMSKDYLLNPTSLIFDFISFSKTSRIISDGAAYDRLTSKKPQFLWNLLNLAVWFELNSKIR